MAKAKGATRPPSDFVRVRRLPERGAYDRQAIHDVLDAARHATVAHVIQGRPVATPTLHWRVGERVYWQFGLTKDAASSLIVKIPGKHLTLILLANSDGLTAPFALQEGDVNASLFARAFLRLFIG